jgi:hypothetical protein
VASWYMWRAVELYGKTRKVAKATSAKKKQKKAGKSKAKKTIRKTKVERKKVGAAKRK